MKKLISILLCVSVIACSFVACSSKKAEESPTNDQNVVTTDAAVIKEADAINLIQKQYSAVELGLSAEDYETCSFMVASSGAEVDGEYYIKVIATQKQEHKNENGESSFTFDIKGEYYISYDGKKILKKDMSVEDKYDELEVKEVPTTKAQ